MKISTRSRYGMRLMLELAIQYGKGPIFLKDIAKSQEISEKYLSQIIMPLKSCGLVTSYRGAHGGYTLHREPAEITLCEIVEALEGDFSLVACVTDPKVCDRSPQCVTQDVWAKVGQAIAGTLGGITLRDLVRESQAKATKQPNFTI